MPDRPRRLPAPAVLLLLCTIIDGASAGVVLRSRPETTSSANADLELREARPGSAPLPLASTTIPFRLLNVVSWPLPTGTSMPSPNLRRANTICGYIGGDPDLPATCSAGSHCVLDSEHNAVGCCPDGSDSCTAGVYTGCVDGDSATDSNPYVYTCSPGSYCYKNDFGGGYYQYGCGSASDLGQSVAATASGKTALALSSERVTFTGTYTATTAESSTASALESSLISSTPSSSLSSSQASSSPSSLMSSSSTLASSSQISSSSLELSSSTTAASSTSSSAESSTAAAAKSTSTHNSSDPSNLDNSGSNKDRAGVIIGATISGVAGLIAVVSLFIFCACKRRKARQEAADGFDDDSSSSGGIFTANKMRKQTKRGPAGFRSSSGNFQALHSSPEDFETGLEPEMIMAMPKPPSSSGRMRGIDIGGPYNAVHVAGNGTALQSVTMASYQTPDDDTWATPAVGGAVGTAVTASVAVKSPKMTAAARNNSIVSRNSSKNSHYGSNYGGPGGPALSRAISCAASDGGRIPPPQAAYQELSPYEGVGPGDGLAQHPLNPYVEGEQVPLTQTYDDFSSRGYNQEVLSRIGEEDEDPIKSIRNSVAAGANLRDSYNHGEHVPSHHTIDLGDESETLPQSASQSSGLSGDISTTMSSSSGTNSGTDSGTNSATNSHLYGTERDSSGVLPFSDQPLNLRGGAGSSFNGSSEDLSDKDATDTNDNDNGRDDNNHADQVGPDPDNTGAYSAMLSAGPPPKSMRPLWQQNRQKTRNLMWS